MSVLPVPKKSNVHPLFSLPTITVTERLRNFLIFNYIKSFVNDLISVYQDDEPLCAYKNLMDENVDIFNNTKNFVIPFEKALTGKHRAKYGEGDEKLSGVYINVPKFLKFKDDNYECIKSHLGKLQKLYNDIETECKEIVWLKTYSSQLSDELSKNNSELNSSLVKLDEPNSAAVNYMFEMIKPFLQKTQKDFKEKNLNNDIFVKMLIINLYDTVDNFEIDPEDLKHIKKILEIMSRTSIKNLVSSELIKEFLMLKTFPVSEVMSSFTSSH